MVSSVVRVVSSMAQYGVQCSQCAVVVSVLWRSRSCQLKTLQSIPANPWTSPLGLLCSPLTNPASAQAKRGRVKNQFKIGVPTPKSLPTPDPQRICWILYPPRSRTSKHSVKPRQPRPLSPGLRAISRICFWLEDI